MQFTISKEEIAEFNENPAPVFPKYTSQLMNWANQNAQGTRPRVVGQMSELFPEYMKQADKVTPEGWRAWYTERHPQAIDIAADRVYAQIENLKRAITLIDRDMVRRWVEDLVFFKTYNGMYVQKAILAKIAAMRGEDYRLACPAEEAVGIDGYVGDTPYSVKPDTYQSMGRLTENIRGVMVYYTKTDTGLAVEVEE